MTCVQVWQEVTWEGPLSGVLSPETGDQGELCDPEMSQRDESQSQRGESQSQRDVLIVMIETSETGSRETLVADTGGYN